MALARRIFVCRSSASGNPRSANARCGELRITSSLPSRFCVAISVPRRLACAVLRIPPSTAPSRRAPKLPLMALPLSEMDEAVFSQGSSKGRPMPERGQVDGCRSNARVGGWSLGNEAVDLRLTVRFVGGGHQKRDSQRPGVRLAQTAPHKRGARLRPSPRKSVKEAAQPRPSQSCKFRSSVCYRHLGVGTATRYTHGVVTSLRTTSQSVHRPSGVLGKSDSVHRPC